MNTKLHPLTHNGHYFAMSWSGYGRISTVNSFPFTNLIHLYSYCQNPFGGIVVSEEFDYVDFLLIQSIP